MRHLFHVETLTGAAPIGPEKKGWIIIHEKGLLSNGHQFICLILTIHRGLDDVFGQKMGLQVLLEVFLIPDICNFFYTGKIFGEESLQRNLHSKLPIFCVKSVNFNTGQKKLHEYIRGVRDKYEV